MARATLWILDFDSVAIDGKYYPECLRKQLENFAISQLNWTLGLNLFDSSMVNGVGRNNPPYKYFDSWEFTNATGGILDDIVSDAVFHQAIIPTPPLGVVRLGLGFGDSRCAFNHRQKVPG